MTSFPKRKILEVQKSLGITGPTYACPICAAPFHSEPKLWLHAKESHPGSLEAIGLSTEAEAKEREIFKQQAIMNAQNKPSQSRRSPIERAEHEKESDANKMVPPSPTRPQTAPEAEERSNPNTSETRRLEKGQMKTPMAGVPQKRGAERGAGRGGSPDPSRDPTTPNPYTRARHSKAFSSGNIQDSEFTRRHDAGTLFDPTINDSLKATNPTRQKSPKTRGHQSRPPRGRNLEPRLKEGLHDSPKKFKPPWPPPQAAKGSSQGLQPDSAGVQKQSQPIVVQKRTGRHERASSPVDDPDDQEDDPEPNPSMLVQPETRPISHDQLVVEVKGIYAGLVMVEAKCIEVDDKQTPSPDDKFPPRPMPLSNDQWRSLIALHKQLLHEHHDFFLASQHPSASSNLSKLAGKYSMPARMWRHGIHGFLEVLRYRLPDAFEHMLAFIYIAYSMMALLYETVPSFEDTWIECLGDLARYRMAIEEEEPRDRETWSGVARYWYSKASDKTPSIGRLYHHLAILARPCTIEQLSLYTKALTCLTPFESTRGSIMTLFKPILDGASFQFNRAFEYERHISEAHGNLFLHAQKLLDIPEEETEKEAKKRVEEAAQHLRNFHGVRRLVMDVLDSWIKCVITDVRAKEDANKTKLKKLLACLATSNVSGILQYGILRKEDGSSGSLVRRAYDDAHRERLRALTKTEDDNQNDGSMRSSQETSTNPAGLGDAVQTNLNNEEAEISRITVDLAADFAFRIFRYALSVHHWEKKDWYRKEDSWIVFLSHVHIMMAFLFGLHRSAPKALDIFENHVPWALLCEFLTRLQKSPGAATPRIFRSDFPRPDNEAGRPLWEDFLIRGTIFAYFPNSWFSDTTLDDEERQLEIPSMDSGRMERVLWLGHILAALNIWIRYDADSEIFLPITRAEQDLETNTTDPTEPDSTLGAQAKDTDTIMADAPMQTVVSPERTSIAPSEAPEASILSTDPSSAAPTPEPSSKMATPQQDPATPTMVGAVEHDDDIPMMDISPSKEHPPEDPSNPVGATAWKPGPVTVTQSAMLPTGVQRPATQNVYETSEDDKK
ncbi:uncharacterized protein KY384_000430 [Bacidia gigantensis]|uniref:uncharacterized protein n=1 Tax=Bacidia gigantensis TaxID=2732470 RepID=UPI001D046BDA|nr:uncharacterized protein KY384_000430 [Bacidia gigantensis]KAG8525670.1 hypothetical protein KY384_000430 [Bacidia gigantensis]